MADRDSEIIARIAPSVGSIPAAEWDALAGHDPFTSHAFLTLLEESGSVGRHSGWSPAPLLVDDEDGKLAAAAPAYLKAHSQGEYVFDHGWAEAWQRAGGDYYPKLQIAAPFTPVPGRRLLGTRPQALIAAAESVVVQNGLSSAHATFIADEEVAEFEARRWLIRDGIQYHWFNRGYDDFDGFLAALASRKRKAIRKERAAARDGLEFVQLRGTGIGSGAWDAMWRFYLDTGSRKWGQPYLTRAFFDGLGEALGDAVLLFLALRDGRPIAGALNLVGEDTIYGRYWGCTEEVPFLHFELSYYQAIEWAIANGLSSVQAGAQGEHKLARGYEPVVTRSAHYLPDPNFRTAVANFVAGERRAIARELETMRAMLPYRRSGSE
ncbi:GNAT family N-acetyltransferase [Sphingomonas sp.]|uniref:GNAT family N-acetyltransferase n=1 Tax=Sphingomonas sp. TaxID=28214 RepID=UPI00325FDB77